MKNIVLIFTCLLFSSLSKAQSDTISLFHQSINAETLEQAGTYKNALNLNLMQFLRGGALIDYERLLGYSGVSIFGGAGFSKFDESGQIYYKQAAYYYEYRNFVTRSGSDLGGVFDLGIKYYTQKVLGKFYVGAGFTTIANSVHTKIIETDDPIYIPASTNRLKYRSNDFKVMFGLANGGNKKFYHDFSLGFGLRFISYQRFNFIHFENSVKNMADTRVVFIEDEKNWTPWLFIYWRMGYRL